MIILKNISNKSGIYKIVCLKNNRIYIGSAKNFQKRIKFHFYELRKNKHGNKHLQRSYNKYKWDDFEFVIMEYCKIEDLIIREQWWIDTLKPRLNQCKRAGNTAGRVCSEESKRKMSESQRGEKSVWFGKQHSEEAKIKMFQSSLKRSKLSQNDIIKIRQLHFNNGIYIAELARFYKVGETSIREIIKYETWKFI